MRITSVGTGVLDPEHLTIQFCSLWCIPALSLSVCSVISAHQTMTLSKEILKEISNQVE